MVKLCIYDLVQQRVELAVLGHKVRLAVELDHRPRVTLHVQPNQTLSSVATLQFLRLAPTLSLGLFLRQRQIKVIIVQWGLVIRTTSF